MENLLPFLLGLIFLGVKYYNKTQKNKKAAAEDKPTGSGFMENTQTSLDDFVNQFIGQEKDPFTPVTATPSYQGGELDEWGEEIITDEVESIEYKEEAIRAPKKNNQFETIQNKPMKEVESTDFDLRKAVINDAILNPPYL